MNVLGRMVAGLRWVAVGLGAAVLVAMPPSAPPADAQQTTGLPLPRFVSLKASRVNVRIGPSNEHAVKWIFVRAGLPVEIVQEFENWRRIRDSSGAEGWVYHGLLSGRRTALVAPWQNAEPTALYVRGDATSTVKANARAERRRAGARVRRPVVRGGGAELRRLRRAGDAVGRLPGRDGAMRGAGERAEASAPRRPSPASRGRRCPKGG